MGKIKFFLFVILSSLWECISRNVNSTSQEEKGAIDSLYYPIDSIPSNGNKVHICKSEDGNMKFILGTQVWEGLAQVMRFCVSFAQKMGNHLLRIFA